jgi:DNA-binding MarR family transcriptional regulator
MDSKIRPTKEVLLQQTIDRFWETIPPMWNHVRSHIRASAAEKFGISVEQFHILRHIARGINNVSALAHERSISRPAASQVVEVLAQKGLLTRQQIPTDRRCVTLSLTENGATLLHAIFEHNRLWMISELEALSSEELQASIQAMETLKNFFQKTIGAVKSE